jgi:hypothetical protein
LERLLMPKLTALRRPALRSFAETDTARSWATHSRPRHLGGGRRSKVKVAGRRAASSGLITVSTAAGIDITVAPEFAGPITGFIRDVVARGYHPRRISCYSWGRGHVANSLHHVGKACDFDQRGWGVTATAMYHVADLSAKWGLRNGGEFRDWGHIDMGPHLSRARQARAIRATPFYGPTGNFKHKYRFAKH